MEYHLSIVSNSFLSTEHLEANFIEILFEIQSFSVKNLLVYDIYKTAAIWCRLQYAIVK